MCKKQVLLFLMAGAIADLLASPAVAQNRYSFTRIADTAGEVAAFPDIAMLNDAGQVAFHGHLKTGANGIYTGSGGPLTTVVDDTASGLFSFGFASINGPGQATYFAVKSRFVGGYFADTNGQITISDSSGPIRGFGGDIFSSTSGSLSTFEAVLKNGQGAILVGNGGPLTTIADTSGNFAAFDIDPRVNGSGQVAFMGSLRDGSQGIFVGNGGPLTTIADTSCIFASFDGAPAISDSGLVLFTAELKSSPGPFPPSGLFLSSGGQIRTIVDPNGPFTFISSEVAINAQGQIAFLASASADRTPTGVYSGPDPVADRIIGVGDPLDGSTVKSFSLYTFFGSINNSGQIAFIAELADGRTGLYRADPDRTPPAVTAEARPRRLVPSKKHPLVSVRVTGTVTDNVAVDLSSGRFSTIDSEGRVQPSGNFTVNADGTYTFTVLLAATREKPGHKERDKEHRSYTISVTARDQADNVGRASARVIVEGDDD